MPPIIPDAMFPATSLPLAPKPPLPQRLRSLFVGPPLDREKIINKIIKTITPQQNRPKIELPPNEPLLPATGFCGAVPFVLSRIVFM